MTNFPPAQRALTEDSLGKTAAPLTNGKVPSQYVEALAPSAVGTTVAPLTNGKVPSQYVDALVPSAVGTTVAPLTNGKIPAQYIDAAAVTPTPTPTTSSYDYLAPIARWHAGIRRRDSAPCLFLTAGSSTTAGQAASTEAKRYVNKVVAAMQAAYPKADASAHPATQMAADTSSVVQPAGIKGINYGVGSTTSSNFITTSDITKMVAQSSTTGIAHLSWMVGSNDWSRDVSSTTFKNNMTLWISRAKTAYVNANKPFVITLIATYGRIDASAQTAPKEPWVNYVTAMRDLALANPDFVAFMDLSNIYKFAGMPGSGVDYDPFDLLTTDDVHQNDYGHDFMAEEIIKKLSVPRTVTVASGGTTPVTPTPVTTFSLVTSDDFATAATTMTNRKTDAALGGTAADVLSATPDAFATSGGFLVPGATRASVETYGLLVGKADGAFEVTVDSITGGTAWIDFRSASTAATSVDTYRLVLSPGDSTFQFSKRASGASNILLGTAVTLPNGETWSNSSHSIRVEWVGSTLKAYVVLGNQPFSTTPSITLTDTSFTAGSYVRLTSTSATTFKYNSVKLYSATTS